MSQALIRRAPLRPGLAAALLGALLLLVTLTGGASSPNVLGQAVVRAGAAILAAAGIAAGLRFDLRAQRAPLLLLAAMAALVAIQLVPLPPGLWRALPGRAAFDIAAIVPETAAWRPAAILPDAAWNALFALVVPAAALLLLSAVPRAELALGVPALIAMVALSSLVAALQFAGSGVDNPLINDRLGFASGLFANRNHQALFLAIGIAATAVWGVARPFRPWRAGAAAAIAAWFLLMILATGSRAGLLLGAVALAGGAALAVPVLRAAELRLPRRAGWAIAGAGALVLAAIVIASIQAGRSESISRLTDADLGADMRVRALPIVLDMVRAYLPVGAGQGGFAWLFMAVEPEALLKPTYFNHAHNDYLELLIEGGLAGAAILAAALAWWARAAWRAWRLPAGGEALRARLGAIVVLLVLMASATDYPARTPLVMATLALAAGWLSAARFTR